MQRLLLIFCVVLLVSCEKDPALTQDVKPRNLLEYLSRVDNNLKVDNLFAHAGNHPSFERETDEQAIHIRMFLPNEYRKVQLFLSDSIQHPDSLELFKLIDKDLVHLIGELFGQFAIKQTQDNRSRLAIVSLETMDSVYISPPILIRRDNSVTNTKNASDVTVQTTPGGRAYISWSGAGIDEPWRNLVEIGDQTGTIFCAVETDNLSFLFHDLRNATRNFTPELRDPRLIEGQTYSLAIYRSDNQGWVRNYRMVEFEADSTRIQEFE